VNNSLPGHHEQVLDMSMCDGMALLGPCFDQV